MSSIRKRPDGKWRARYRDEAGLEHSRHFDRKVDGQRFLDEINASIVTGQYVDPNAGKITFKSFYASWSSRQVWVGGTKRAVDLAASSVEFETLPLRALRPSHVESWVRGMTNRGLAASTVQTRFNYVHSALRAAVRDRLIARDPAENITLPRLRKSEAAMVLPTTEQVKALLDAAEPEMSTMVALAAFAGLRAAEIRGLQLGDVAFLGRTLSVQRQAQNARGGSLEVRPPKYHSERAVYLPDGLLTILSTHVAARAIADPAAWLFKARRTDAPVHESTVTSWWDKARKKAKVPGIKLHDLRHFYASGLISEGCDVVTVQRALGHSSPAMTLGVYSHLWPSAEDRTRRAAGVLLSAVVGGAADSVRTGNGG